MILPKLKGRGLFIFSDPGGAKPVLSLIKLSEGLKDFKIISDRVYDFFNDFNLEIDPYIPGFERSILNEFKPDFLFTGTSYTSKIELKFIKEAEKANIHSIAFIDHYSKFKERFEWNNEYCFPSKIAVIDDAAYNKAIEAGLSEEKLIITGNPYHRFIKNWKPLLSKEKFFKENKFDLNKKTILYAPDPISNVGGKEKYGFDEGSALKDLMGCLQQCNYEFQLIVKPHPNQNIRILEPFLKHDNLFIATNIHLNTLIFYSNIVISFFSNILTEAVLLNVPTCRMLIGLKGEDYLNMSESASLPKISGKFEFIQILKSI